MTTPDYDYLVFIGRFQPFHRAHQGVVAQALARAEQVILLLGSAASPRTVANPWTLAEREAMIRSIYDDATNARITIRGIADYPYDDAAWQRNVVQTVAEISGTDAKVGLIGHIKDDSSYYLELFPDWGLLAVENIDHISATDVRDYYFSLPEQAHLCYDDLHANIIQALEDFRGSAEEMRLRAEFAHIQAWRNAWANTPYPPVFVTVDACVVCAGHVLMVQRKGPLGAGLWALPGGFIEQDETLAEGALRELREETGLICTVADITQAEVFAKPDRSARGRTITHVHYIDLGDATLPAVQAADDAVAVRWQALATLDSRLCFEDHYSIIQILTSRQRPDK